LDPAVAHPPTPGGPALRSLAVGDVDGDGLLDVVAAGEALVVFRGHGDGTLAAPVATALPSPVSGLLTVGDLDGDGRPDVVAGGAVLRGLGDGTFQPGSSTLPPLASADLDGD